MDNQQYAKDQTNRYVYQVSRFAIQELNERQKDTFFAL